MKKYIIAVLALTLVGGAGAWYYLRPPQVKLVVPEKTPKFMIYLFYYC